MPSEFVAWRRSGVHELGTDVRRGGRRQASIRIELAEPGEAPPPGPAMPFELLGPLDVAGLVPSAIRARLPAPGASDATETRLAQIELEPADLPWRYTPFRPDGNQALAPWLVLVVAEPGAEAEFLGGLVRLRGDALRKHRLDESSRWAHVHTVEDGAGETRTLARVVSPRDLDGDTDYVAVLVPAFAKADNPEGIAPAWTNTSAEVELPWYDRWAFRTGPEGDFEQIAARIEPVADGELDATFGVARLGHPALPATDEPLRMRAALSRIPPASGPQPDAGPVPPPVALRTKLWTETPEVDGHWVLGLPRYDEPWPGTETDPWRVELRSDPRRRGAAGLGAWAGIEWQQRIVDAAAAQAGALAAAAQRVSQLSFGLLATRSVWAHRFPADAVGRLVLLGPTLARIPAGEGTTVIDHIAGRVPGRLVPELFSSAARRVLRPGPARTALAKPGAARPAAILEAANTCPERPAQDEAAIVVERIVGSLDRPLDRGLAAILEAARDRLSDEDQLGRFSEAIDRMPSWIFGHGAPWPDLLAALDPGDERPPDLDRLERLARDLPREHPGFHPEEIVDLLGDPEPEDRCRPLDLGGLAGIVVEAVDPNAARPIAVDVVLAPIRGLEEPVLAPPELSPELDLPLWKFLDERARDWLLPGVGQLKPDRVTMVQTNPGFVDAILVGANHQALGELRWRNLPVNTAWTPLRRFWSRIPDPHDPASLHTDIREIRGWPEDSPLGDARHRTDPSSGEDLVVVFRSELFRRYPSTLVYLFPADADWRQTPADLPDAQRDYPAFAGSIGPDVVFFGFRVTPDEGRTRWVVLEEPPPGFRFYGETPPDWPPAGPPFDQARAEARNGAAYAGITFARPVRVFLGNVLA